MKGTFIFQIAVSTAASLSTGISLCIWLSLITTPSPVLHLWLEVEWDSELVRGSEQNYGKMLPVPLLGPARDGYYLYNNSKIYSFIPLTMVVVK